MKTAQKKYMTVGNVKRLEKRLDKATSELLNAMELFDSIQFQDDENDAQYRTISAEMERVQNCFMTIVNAKHRFEIIAENLAELKEQKK